VENRQVLIERNVVRADIMVTLFDLYISKSGRTIWAIFTPSPAPFIPDWFGIFMVTWRWSRMTRADLLYRPQSEALPSEWILLSSVDSLGLTPFLLRVFHSQTLWIPFPLKHCSISLLLIELMIESLTRSRSAYYSSTRIPYLSESSEYSGVNSLNMESLNMTSVSVIISKKAIFRLQEDSVQFTAQQSRFPTFRIDGPEEASGHPSVFEEVSEHLSRHQPQETHVYINVMIAQRMSTLESTSVRTAN